MSQRTLKFIRAALIVALAVLLAGTSALADSVAVKLNASAKVYQSASGSAHYIKAPKGLKVTLKAYAGGWGRISYKGYTGYIKLKYLDRVKPLKAYAAKSAVVYKDAGGSRKLTTIPAGTVVYAVGVDGSYVRVIDKSGTRKGYIKADALSGEHVSGDRAPEDGDGGSSVADTVPESLRSNTTSAGDSKIEYTIYVAQNLIGAPYASSANPPKTFDCAKYAYYCYGKAKSGTLKSSTKAQGYDERYQKIEYDDLKRGDLVCFDTISDDDLCDHVGIYLGGGYFLHASSAAKKVILSSLSSGYYKRTFSWGLRIFES